MLSIKQRSGLSGQRYWFGHESWPCDLLLTYWCLHEPSGRCRAAYPCASEALRKGPSLPFERVSALTRKPRERLLDIVDELRNTRPIYRRARGAGGERDQKGDRGIPDHRAMEAVAARCPATGSTELKSASGCPAQDAGSEGGGRPSILAMVWLRPPPWVQSEVVTPIGLLVILPMQVWPLSCRGLGSLPSAA